METLCVCVCVCCSGLKDLVDDRIERSSLVTLLVTAQNEHTLHPVLTEVQGSHFFQSFCKIESPTQVSSKNCLHKVGFYSHTGLLFYYNLMVLRVHVNDFGEYIFLKRPIKKYLLAISI